jgi:hypothetical protein
MPETEIDEQKFVELILTEFPQLREDFDEWKGLDHLQMMEFKIFTEKAGKNGDWDTVERCLRLADVLLRQGDAAIKNAIYVTYLEELPRHGEIHDRIRHMMTPELRQGWDDILAYLEELLGKKMGEQS